MIKNHIEPGSGFLTDIYILFTLDLSCFDLIHKRLYLGFSTITETLYCSSVFTTVQLCLVISLYVSCVNGKPVGIQMGVDRLRWPMF